MVEIDTNTGAKHLRHELNRTIIRHATEYDISYANIVGILHSIAFDLLCDAAGVRQEGSDDR